MQAFLILANGRVFRGVSVGCPGTTIGEVVFATGMVGFEETLTAPSYYGQIIPQPSKSPPTSAVRKRWIPS